MLILPTLTLDDLARIPRLNADGSLPWVPPSPAGPVYGGSFTARAADVEQAR